MVFIGGEINALEQETKKKISHFFHLISSKLNILLPSYFASRGDKDFFYIYIFFAFPHIQALCLSA